MCKEFFGSESTHDQVYILQEIAEILHFCTLPMHIVQMYWREVLATMRASDAIIANCNMTSCESKRSSAHIKLEMAAILHFVGHVHKKFVRMQDFRYLLYSCKLFP